MSDLSGGAAFGQEPPHTSTPVGGPPPPPPPPPPPGNYIAPPPGYVPYGGQNVGAFGSFQNVMGLGRSLAILLIILVPLQAITLLTTASLNNKAKDFINGSISSDDFKSSLTTTGLVSLLSGAVTLAIFVLTVIWMFRMAKNQRAMQRGGTWGPSVAIWGWFVPPCVLYVVPYLMFRDLWKSSDPESSHDWRSNKVGGVVTVWWVLFGLAPLATLTVTFSRFKISNGSDLDAAKNVHDRFGASMLSTAVQMAAAVAFLFVVRQLTQRHARTTHEAG